MRSQLSQFRTETFSVCQWMDKRRKITIYHNQRALVAELVKSFPYGSRNQRQEETVRLRQKWTHQPKLEDRSAAFQASPHKVQHSRRKLLITITHPPNYHYYHHTHTMLPWPDQIPALPKPEFSHGCRTSKFKKYKFLVLDVILLPISIPVFLIIYSTFSECFAFTWIGMNSQI